MQQIYNKIPLLILTVFMAGACLAGCKKKDMSLKLNEPRNIKGVISYKRSFGDLNEKHLNIAQTIGIPPIASRTEAEGMKKKLQHIETNDLYKVDSLTHSIPYLIPGAARLLDSIGSHFLDSLASKGLNPSKVVVGRRDAPAPPQRERFRQLRTFLRDNIRCQLEAFPESGR